WRLNRCLFVGDAGMVWAANQERLSRGGGRYILCMPIQRGGEVAEAGRSATVTRNDRHVALSDPMDRRLLNSALEAFFAAYRDARYQGVAITVPSC
ncbi:MAG: hypothetical protein WB819_16335, partial [Terriglobia bacterium]